MKDTKYELLIVIANQGYSGLIMDAARSENAGGGTVIHAKGTGMERAEQFLGVSLAAEKEMVLIVIKREDKNRHHARHHGSGGHRQQGTVGHPFPARHFHRRPAPVGRRRAGSGD